MIQRMTNPPSKPLRKWKRATAKSLTWKIVGIITLVLISMFLGVDPVVTGKLTILYHVITLVLFIFHERAWSKSKYGKKKTTTPKDIKSIDS